MSSYPKTVERPYRVYAGEPERTYSGTGVPLAEHWGWAYQHSFWTEEEAAAYAEQLSKDFQRVKIEKKEATE